MHTKVSTTATVLPFLYTRQFSESDAIIYLYMKDIYDGVPLANATPHRTHKDKLSRSIIFMQPCKCDIQTT